MSADPGNTDCTTGMTKAIFDAWTVAVGNGLVDPLTGAPLTMLKAMIYGFAIGICGVGNPAWGGSSNAWFPNRAFTETPNGILLVFHTAAPFNAIAVYLNGQRLTEGASFDYQATGITFDEITFAVAPPTGAILTCDVS